LPTKGVELWPAGPLDKALLENGIEDEKASAGDHRAHRPRGRALGPWWTAAVMVVINSISISFRGDVPVGLGCHPEAGSSTIESLLRQVKISTESLILAQDERWRRA
jgi:hypothetical protein